MSFSLRLDRRELWGLPVLSVRLGLPDWLGLRVQPELLVPRVLQGRRVFRE
jgi:hypothetical protein